MLPRCCGMSRIVSPGEKFIPFGAGLLGVQLAPRTGALLTVG